MNENNNSKLGIVLTGIIKENPVLILLLGTCPTLATTTSVSPHWVWELLLLLFSSAPTFSSPC